MSIKIIQTINQGSTAVLQFTISDGAGAVIDKDSITTATLKLTLKGTDTVINSKSAEDILSNIDSSGICTYELEPSDNTIVEPSPGSKHESHLATIKIVTNDNRIITEEIEFRIVDLEQDL